MTVETIAPASSSLFTLGDTAAARVAKLLEGEPENSLLRVSVLGGGCSGFQYVFAFETAAPSTDDLLVEKAGARVAIDAVSLEFLKDARLDYVETLGGAAFEIVNPNTKASCGCGNSFSVM